MAIMSHKKRAIAQGWEAKNKQREKEAQTTRIEEKPISQEEHNKRVQILRQLGILKE
jgi:hypothetical protein